MKKLYLILIILPVLVFAQSGWQRGPLDISQPVDLFHAQQSANLPTTQMLKQHNFLFEISHRFGIISDGYDNFYGFDGPVSMRIALGYGLMDNLMITLGRSNILDNLDLSFKYRLLDFDHSSMPSALAVNAGIAFNSEPTSDLEMFNTNHMQYFGQIIYNIMFLEKRLGIGIVPSFVYNSYILDSFYGYEMDPQYTITIGSHCQYYFNRMWSVWAEFSPVVSGYHDSIFDKNDGEAYNPLAIGAAIETGGHIFNIFITNSSRLNAAQYLVGSDSDTGKDAWRLAFGITREL
jgi:hypothetical protein